VPLLLTVGVGGGIHGALGHGAPEHDGGGADALTVGAVAGLPAVERPHAHGHQYPLLLGFGLLPCRRHLLARGSHGYSGSLHPPTKNSSQNLPSPLYSEIQRQLAASVSSPLRIKQQWHCTRATPSPRPGTGVFRTRAVGARGRKRRATRRLDGRGRRSGERPHTGNSDKITPCRSYSHMHLALAYFFYQVKYPSPPGGIISGFRPSGADCAGALRCCRDGPWSPPRSWPLPQNLIFFIYMRLTSHGG
jgi:hypothetical protein